VDFCRIAIERPFAPILLSQKPSQSNVKDIRRQTTDLRPEISRITSTTKAITSNM
jgi:hypothetical protein